MKYFITGIIVFSIVSGCRQSMVQYPETLSQLHLNVISDILENPADPEIVKNYLSELKEDVSWPDIDYSSKERGGWPPAGHLSRLLEIAKAYQSKESEFYQDNNVSEKIHLALNFWLENDFICPNWWYPEIGVPRILNPLMILMEAELSEEQKEKGIKILNRSAIGMTGQNKVWQSGNVLLRNLLLKNEDTIRLAASSIQEELVVSTGEGVQPDWSYHQHGPQLQFGNYGLAYVTDMMKWIAILRNTPFQFDEQKVEILRNYLLEGQQWVTWKEMYDISACGRQLFPNAQKSKAATLARSLSKMEQLDPQFAADYKKANQYQNLSGNRHFWRSDFQVQRTPGYYFSVKMCSERVIGAESCNSENLQGYYMGDGVTFLYQTGEEYRNIFPFWDWKKIPGTTVQQDNDTLPVLTASGYRINSDFVGGIAGQGVGKYPAISVAAMDYNRNGLEARKAWFSTGELIICLGSNITSKTGLSVTTSLNQSFLNGEIYVKNLLLEKINDVNKDLKDPKWIIHDNIGYFFPDGGKLKLENQDVEGSWNWVASRYPEEISKKKIFKLWIEHGANPNMETYQYFLVPNATESKMLELEANPSVIIYNEEDKQEVATANGWSRAIIFYKPGKSDALGGFEVDKPCIVIIEELMGATSVRVTDPTQKLEEINIKIENQWEVKHASVNSENVVTVKFQPGEQFDNSFQFSLEKK